MLGHDEGRHRFKHRHFNSLAAAGARALQQCCHYRVDHSQPDCLVADQGRNKAGVAACRQLERNEPAAALDDVVECRSIGERAVLPVALSRAIDEPRVDLLQPFPGKAETGHRLWPHVVHQDVAVSSEPEQYRRRFGPLQIEHQGTLVAIEIEKDVTHLAVPSRAGIAHDVALGRFDLDHLGTEIAQDLCRQRPEDDCRQIEYLDPSERARSRCVHRGIRLLHYPLP